MNPTANWWQVVVTLPFLAVAAFTPAQLVPLTLGAALLSWWLFLDVTYGAALGARGRSAKRIRGDHHVAAQALLLGIMGVLVGLLAFDRDLRITESVPLAVCLATLGLVGVGLFASSLVDWYYIRPRLDGVVREPPCRSSRAPIWGSVTRTWYQHRAVTEILMTGGGAVAFTALVAGLIVPDDEGAKGAVTIAGLLLGVLVGAARWSMGALRNYAMAPPRLWLGDLLKDPDGGDRAYLLHVSAAGLVVKEWDLEEGVWNEPRDVRFVELESRRFHPKIFTGCAECSLINPNCEWATARHGGGHKHRFVI